MVPPSLKHTLQHASTHAAIFCMTTAPPGNGEAFRSVCSLTLSGGFDAASVYRLALSRFAARLRHHLLVLIKALLISYNDTKNTPWFVACQA